SRRTRRRASTATVRPPTRPCAGAGAAIGANTTTPRPCLSFPLRNKLSVRIRTVQLDEDYWLERGREGEKRTLDRNASKPSWANAGNRGRLSAVGSDHIRA